MTETTEKVIAAAAALFAQLADVPAAERMDAINRIRESLHAYSPMKHHPVDCVVWVDQTTVASNSYNPNTVAPPEMKLLVRSIVEDGYTQPIVVWQMDDDHYEIIDGYHRARAAVSPQILPTVNGLLPVTVTNTDRTNKVDRMASTIRHNRARGEHGIDEIQTIVMDMVQSGMSDAWIMKHVGMDVDELLRMKQLTGVAALFHDADFSQAWVASEEESPEYE